MWLEAVGEAGSLFFPVNSKGKKGDAVGSGVWDQWCGFSDNTGRAWGAEHSLAFAAAALRSKRPSAAKGVKRVLGSTSRGDEIHRKMNAVLWEKKLARISAKCDFEILAAYPWKPWPYFKTRGSPCLAARQGRLRCAPRTAACSRRGRCHSISWSPGPARYSPAFFISPDVWSPFCFEIVLQPGQSLSALARSHGS